MLFLLLKAGSDFYALSAEQVEVVVPFAYLKQVPGAPETVAGILNYRGDQIAIIDCGTLLAGIPSAAHTNTRIILCTVNFSQGVKRIGLLGEQITQAHRFEESDFKPAAVRTGDLKCTGSVAVWNDILVQQLHPEKAISTELLNTLMVEE